MAIPKPQLANKRPGVPDDDEITRMARERLASRNVAPQAKSETNVPLGAAVANVARDTPSRLGEISPKPAAGRAGTPSRVGAPKPADDELDSLARSRAEREAERKAAADELARGKADALADTDARAGLGGFGLSGGTAALRGDVGRTQDRGATLAMAELDRGQRDEDFTAIQRQAALDDLEAATDTDYDGDGEIDGVDVDGGAVGDGDPDNNPATAPRGTEAEQAALAAANDVFGSNDYNQSPFGDADTQPGSFEEPFDYAGTKSGLEAYISEYAPGALPLTKVTGKDGLGGDVTIYVDKYGNHYTIKADTGRQSRRERAVAERDG